LNIDFKHDSANRGSAEAAELLVCDSDQTCRPLRRLGHQKAESYLYDSEARLTSLIHADNTSVAYTCDPRDQILTVQDENHTTPNTFYTYDPAGRLIRIDQTLAAGRRGARQARRECGDGA
jgi:YD repeat-containing protein